jgi:hypothetical protein
MATKKKVVKAAPVASDATSDDGAKFVPTAEAKAKATQFRIIAVVLWVLGLGVEAFGIFYVLKRVPVNWILLVAAFVVDAVLVIIGSQLWKKANALDPASKKNKVAWFIQNQLGVIIAMIAFVPIIVLVFLNKNLDGKQKGILGAVGIVIALAAMAFSWDFSNGGLGPSQEQYSSEVQVIASITGVQDPAAQSVCWVKNSKVYHLCQDASDLQQESADNTITCGTVAEAHAAGMDRLTLKVEQEIKQCGFTGTVPADNGESAESSEPAAEESEAAPEPSPEES